jgi:hypothetical protein
MSEQGTLDIAERAQLDRDLGAAIRTKPVQLVNNPTPIQPTAWIGVGITPDPNDTVETVPHPSPVRDRLRAAVADSNTSEQDCQAARETLRISFHE